MALISVADPGMHDHVGRVAPLQRVGAVFEESRGVGAHMRRADDAFEL